MDTYSLGRYLRETRESKEHTLEEAVAALKIRRRILEGFEQGDFSAGDVSSVQIRGFVRNYARFLGLDEDLIIQYYESALSDGRHRKPRKRKREAHTDNSALPAQRSITDTPTALPRVTLGEQREASERQWSRLFNTVIMLAVGMAALAVIFFVVVQLLNQPEDTIEPEQRAILGRLPPTSTRTPAPSFTPRPVITDLPPLQNSYTGQGVVVTIEIQQRTWLHVLTDGNEQINRLALPGEVLEYQGLSEVFVDVSNANALNILYNGQQQGSFGGRGQAAEITFTMDGVSIITGPGFDPTPIFSPTPHPTEENLAATVIVAHTPSNTPGPSPTPSATPSITNTPTYTATPSNTPTITLTPSDTPPPSNTPTITPTPTISPTPTNTAVLPPRATPPNLTPTKEGA